MASVNYTVVLDLTDNGCIQTGWRLKQGDSGNSTIIAKVVNNGVDAYDPNVTPEIAFKRADGNSVLSTMTASDGYYNYTFVGNELAVAGPVVMDVTFTDEEARTSTASCRFEVVADPAGYDPEGAHTYDNPVSVLVGRATEDALIAEGFAVGQQRGQDVPETSPYYHNNAKYYSELSDPTAFANMSDVDFNNLQNGQVPVYNSTSGKWENSSGGGGASALNELTDVDLTDPTEGQALIYDSLNSEWINGSAGATNLNGLSDVSVSTPTNNQVLKYDSANNVWKNANESGGGGGSSVTITTTDSTLYGATVTLSDGTTTLTTTFSNSGEAAFSGVTMTGSLTVACGGDSMVVSVPYFGNYEFVFSTFSATITVTYPSGATCTCVGGGESQTATSNPQTFTVHSANTFRITATVDSVDKYTDVTITTDGQTESVTIQFGTINVTLDADFVGETITCVNGGTTISKTASTTSLVFYPPTTGTWVISGEVSGTTYSVNAEVTSLSTPVSVSLQTLATVTVTLYSATEDTVTFTDGSGSKTEVFASGQSSKSITLAILPTGQSITFTSSVAKDPSNLSNDYSKTVTVTSATTEIYLMPENTLYWFGFEREAISFDRNGSGGYVTKNKNNISIGHYLSTSSNVSTVYTTNQVTLASKFRAIINYGNTVSHIQNLGVISNISTTFNNATFTYQTAITPKTAMDVYEVSTTAQTGNSFYAGYSTNCYPSDTYIHAMWLE